MGTKANPPTPTQVSGRVMGRGIFLALALIASDAAAGQICEIRWRVTGHSSTAPQGIPAICTHADGFAAYGGRGAHVGAGVIARCPDDGERPWRSYAERFEASLACGPVASGASSTATAASITWTARTVLEFDPP